MPALIKTGCLHLLSFPSCSASWQFFSPHVSSLLWFETSSLVKSLGPSYYFTLVHHLDQTTCADVIMEISGQPSNRGGIECMYLRLKDQVWGRKYKEPKVDF